MSEITDSTRNNARQIVAVGEKLCNEAYVITVGTAGGALREVAKHPVESVGETAAMSLAGVGLTAVAAAEIPIVSTVAVGAGLCYSTGYAWNLIDPGNVHNIDRNRAFGAAVATAWSTSDSGKLETSIHDLQRITGRDSLLVLEGLVAGGAAVKFGARIPEIIRRMPGEVPSVLATAERLAPTWFKVDGKGTIPTWDQFVYFNRRHGEVRTMSVRDFEVREVAKVEQRGKPELAKLRGDDQNLTKVTDGQGRHLLKDSNSGELIQETPRQPDPKDDGLDTGGSFYFRTRYRP